jgi:hypothetical protein
MIGYSPEKGESCVDCTAEDFLALALGLTRVTIAGSVLDSLEPYSSLTGSSFGKRSRLDDRGQ